MVGVANAVLSIEKDDARPVPARFGIVQQGEGGDDDQVAGLGQVGGGTIDADDSGAHGARDGIRP